MSVGEEYIAGYVHKDLEADTLRRALIHMAAWVKHWQEDRACNLMPTEGSLAEAAELIRNALNQ